MSVNLPSFLFISAWFVAVLLGLALPAHAGKFDSVSHTGSSPVDPRTNAPLPPGNPVAASPVVVATPHGSAVVPNTGKYTPEIALPAEQGIKVPDHQPTQEEAEHPARPALHSMAPGSLPRTDDGATDTTVY